MKLFFILLKQLEFVFYFKLFKLIHKSNPIINILKYSNKKK